MHALIKTSRGMHLQEEIYVFSKKVKLSLCLTKHYAMKSYGGVDV
jgi:hypothetical protein